ncbi:MAG: hypothetical protein ACE5GL_05260, partial [Calditrichia bacterium]
IDALKILFLKETIYKNKADQKAIVSKFTAILVIARLNWGSLISPLNWKYNFTKIFPAPKKSVYKQGLANYFFRN